MVHTLKMIGSGKSATVVDEYSVDTAVLAARRAVERAAAEELAQLQRLGAGDTYNIDKAVMVRVYDLSDGNSSPA